MKKILILLFSIGMISCNHALFVKKQDVICVKKGCILLIANEYYFVEEEFHNDTEFHNFILKQNKTLFKLSFKVDCILTESLSPLKFSKFRENIIPQGSSMSGGEILYLNALIKLIDENIDINYGSIELYLKDYDNLQNQYILKYKIENKMLYQIISNSEDNVRQ